VVGAGVADEEQARLAESGLDLVSEGAGGEATSDGGRANVAGELEHGALGVGPLGNYEHIGGVLNGSDGSGRKDELLPGFPEVDDVDAVRPSLEDVLLHSCLAVLRPDVGGGSQHLGDVILRTR